MAQYLFDQVFTDEFQTSRPFVNCGVLTEMSQEALMLECLAVSHLLTSEVCGLCAVGA